MRGGRCGGDGKQRSDTCHPEPPVFHHLFFPHSLWRRTGKSSRFLLPSCVRLLSCCCHSNRAPSSYWAYSVGSWARACVLLVPLCVCVRLLERFQSSFLVDLKDSDMEGASAGFAGDVWNQAPWCFSPSPSGSLCGGQSGWRVLRPTAAQSVLEGGGISSLARSWSGCGAGRRSSPQKPGS